MAEPQVDHQTFRDLLENMTDSIRSTRETIKKISAQSDIETKDGISLLSLKHHLMLSYLQSLALLSAHRVLGHTLADKSSTPRKPFTTTERGSQGSQPGDLVDSMVENRIVLEKVKLLENKMRYQIDKLVRLAEETPESNKEIADDPLAFRPNPQNLVNQEESGGSASEDESESDYEGKARDGIYHPPKLAPMPYNEASERSKKERKRPIPTALAQLSHLDPHLETTSGVGGVPTLQSARARELVRMTEFEEENFTRLVMKKKDMKRRLRDEADIALGGTGAGAVKGGRGRRGFGLEDEFADVLKSVNRRKESAIGDGYEELRQRGKKDDAFSRARARSKEEVEEVADGRPKKKGRFEKDQAIMKKIMKKRSLKR